MANEKKAKQLGMPIGTATARLRKALLFSLLEALDQNVCYRCGTRIITVDDLSIDHKIAWLDSDDPITKFFDLNNIAFSHLHCNISVAKKPKSPHGSRNRYCNHGCRCAACCEANTIGTRKYRAGVVERHTQPS